ncbi:MAG: hypothetical protein ACKODS_07640, partial [Methylophilaceae bacterium]
MIQFLLYSIIAVHGLIHLIGFAEAFRLMPTAQFTKNISKPVGVAWLLACVLFLAGGVLLFAQHADAT